MRHDDAAMGLQKRYLEARLQGGERYPADGTRVFWGIHIGRSFATPLQKPCDTT